MFGKVSIIMPAYNCAEFIGIAIESVIAQTYTNWELIIVDDCSTDGTKELLCRYREKDERIVYIPNSENNGAAYSRNKAIDQASGKYLAFLDSDDVWQPTKLEEQLHFMEKNGYAFSCTAYNKIDENGNDLNNVIPSVTLNYEGMLKRCPGNSTVMYNSEMLGKYSIPLIRKRNDYVMWLGIIKKAKMIYGLDKVLSSHRVRTDSLSANKATLVKYQWIVYRDIEKLSIPKSAYLVAFQIYKSIFKVK